MGAANTALDAPDISAAVKSITILLTKVLTYYSGSGNVKFENLSMLIFK